VLPFVVADGHRPAPGAPVISPEPPRAAQASLF